MVALLHVTLRGGRGRHETHPYDYFHSKSLWFAPLPTNVLTSIVAQMPADSPVTSSYITLNGLKLHYLSAGDRGPPLLLLHGTALDSAKLTYGQLMPKLSQNFRVFALDWPGYGKSDKPVTEYTMAFYEEVLRAFVTYLELDKVNLVAFSMGGGVALQYALARPDQLISLVLIDSYGLGSSVHVPLLPYLALRLPGIAPALWWAIKQSRFLLRWCLKRFVFGRSTEVTEQLVDEVRAQLELEGLQFAFTNWLRGEVGRFRLVTSHHTRLRQLDVPTLLVHGSRDLIIPAYRSRRAAKALPNAQLHIIKGAGHWTPREAPEAVCKALEDFLSNAVLGTVNAL